MSGRWKVAGGWLTGTVQVKPQFTTEKEIATLSSILAWRIPWREEPGRLQSMGQQVGRDLATKQPPPQFTTHATAARLQSNLTCRTWEQLGPRDMSKPKAYEATNLSFQNLHNLGTGLRSPIQETMLMVSYCPIPT